MTRAELPHLTGLCDDRSNNILLLVQWSVAALILQAMPRAVCMPREATGAGSSPASLS
jgi:hypothetical protein